MLDKLRTNIKTFFRYERKYGLYFNLRRQDVLGSGPGSAAQPRILSSMPYTFLVEINVLLYLTSVSLISLSYLSLS